MLKFNTRFGRLTAGLLLTASLTAPVAFAQESEQDPSAVTVPAGDQAPAPQLSAPPATPDVAAPAADQAAPPPPPAAPVVDAKALPSANQKAASDENPYGLSALWKNGDLIARGVLLIMAFMSVGTWIIIVMKLIEQQRLFKASKQVTDGFWDQKSIQQASADLSEDSPFRYIAESGVVAAEHHEGTMREGVNAESWISMSIERAVGTINSRLQTHLAFLGTVGSTSPFIGLFGTVWGIYHALTAIGISGQASIDKVAGPVGESLIMTAIGLATAVPAVLGYNLLVRRNKVGMDDIRNFAGDVLAVLIGGQAHNTALESFNRSQQQGNGAPTTITTSSRV